MCELLGMSANVPTDIRFSFTGLARRGGENGPHRDGWGVAFHEGRSCRCFHDTEPSASSALATMVRDAQFKSHIAIAHVRRANRGRVALENTHPFTRALWGRTWSFAHNGQLKGVKRLPTGAFTPIGTTDSEHAFCWLLHRLAGGRTTPPSERLLETRIAALFGELRQLGVFNALLSDGRGLYASCSKALCAVTRAAPFTRATLVDEDLAVDFSTETGPDDVVTILATHPLTRDEAWTTLERDSTYVLRSGRIQQIAAALTKPLPLVDETVASALV
jgi:glutamine amidotransferase